MKGRETLWVPGTDHAGIATQNVVEKQLAKEGLTRQDLGREAFVERTVAFVNETGGVILEQLRAIGASADWSRTAYTFSPELSGAVREAFVRLYERGLIYKGHRVIHWCPRCLTSLSDEEAEPEAETGALYHLSYPLVESELPTGETAPRALRRHDASRDDARRRRRRGEPERRALSRADRQARPAADPRHPDPDRRRRLRGSGVRHGRREDHAGARHERLRGRSSPRAADARRDRRARRDERSDGCRGPCADGAPRHGPLRGARARRRDARSRSAASRRRRCTSTTCGTATAARPSSSRGSATSGSCAWRRSPSPRSRRCARVACVSSPRSGSGCTSTGCRTSATGTSRGSSGGDIACPSGTAPTCPGAAERHRRARGSDELSALRRSGRAGRGRARHLVLELALADLHARLAERERPSTCAPSIPTDVLVTAPEIIFFWVARMIMSGYAFMGDAPFHSVYLHGTARDTKGRKMSKSLGNGIDPLDVVKLYGADALRYTLDRRHGTRRRRDARSVGPREVVRARPQLRDEAVEHRPLPAHQRGHGAGASRRRRPIVTSSSRADAWILDRLDVAVRECDRAIGPLSPAPATCWRAEELSAGLRLNEYAETARRFVWNELADWYLEAIKTRLATPGDDREVARAVLLHVFDQALRLLHPIVPFVTEALWQRLPGHVDGTFLATASWPAARAGADADASDGRRVRADPRHRRRDAARALGVQRAARARRSTRSSSPRPARSGRSRAKPRSSCGSRRPALAVVDARARVDRRRTSSSAAARS